MTSRQKETIRRGDPFRQRDGYRVFRLHPCCQGTTLYVDEGIALSGPIQRAPNSRAAFHCAEEMSYEETCANIIHHYAAAQEGKVYTTSTFGSESP